MKRYILLLLLLLPAQAFSQFVVQGSVQNERKEAVAYASAVLFRAADSVTVAYTATDESGKFTLQAKAAGTYVLHVTCLGYATAAEAVQFSAPATIERNIVLTEDAATRLHGVSVTARNTGIQYQGDTIRYDPKHFTDGSEEVLGDVLNKLPGIEVDDSGNVKAQGKQVEGILLNGQDFFSGNTQMATKNLPADIADTVDVLHHYSDYSLLNGFQSHDKTVINVGVGKDKLGRISGQLLAGGGVKEKYAGRATVMQIGQKLMTSWLGALNNTGDEVFSMDDYMQMQGGIMELANSNTGSTITLSGPEAELLTPQNNTYKRRNGLGAFNMAWQPTEKVKMNAYFIFNDQKEAFLNRTDYHYLLPDNVFERMRQSDGNGGSRLYSGMVQLRYKPSKTFDLTYKGTISNADMNRATTSVNTMAERQIDAWDGDNGSTIKTRHDVMLLKALGKNLLTAKFNFAYSHAPSLYDMRTDSLLLPLPLAATDGWFYGRQRSKTDQLTAGGNIGFMYKLSDAYFFNFSLNAAYNHQQYNSAIFQNLPGQTPVELTADSLRNDIRTELYDYNAGVSLVRNKGLLQFTLGAFGHLYQFRNSALGSAHTLKLNPDVNVSLHFSRQHSLTLSFATTDDPLSPENYLSGLVFNSYDGYSYASAVSKRFSTAYNANLSYNIFDMFSNTMVVLTGTYHRTTSVSDDYTQNGLLTAYRPIIDAPTDYLSFYLFFNKGLGNTAWVAKLNAGYSLTDYADRVNGAENDIQSQSLSGQLQIESNYRDWVCNFEFRAGISYYNNRSSFGDAYIQTIQRYGGKLKFNVGKNFFAAVELEYAFNHAPGYRQNQYSLNADITYKISKHLGLELSGMNMLHLNRQAWVTTSYNGIYTSENYYRQIPGNILLRIKYTF